MAVRLIAILLAGGLVGAAWGQSSTGPLAVEDRAVGEPVRETADEGRDEAVMMLMEELQQYRQETAELRGMVENLQHQLETMKKAQRERYLDLDSRLNALAEASLEPAENESADGENSESRDPAADRRAYQAAREKLLERDFEAAGKAFEQYLNDYPEGEFRPFAHFWLGEVYRNREGKQQQALKQFRTVVESYSDHSKVPAALYKLAALQAETGETGKAKVTLEKLLIQYPDSSEAAMARDTLDRLKQGD